MKVANVGGINCRIIFGPEDFAGVELVGHALEEVNAGLANLIALCFPVVNLILVKLVGAIFDQA
jgi:hypothetical protein